MPSLAEIGSTFSRGGITIVAESDSVDVGQIIFPVALSLPRWEPDEIFHQLLNTLNGNHERSESMRRNLIFSLTNNCSNGNPLIKHERAVSCYYTYSPGDQTVTIEWGLIDPDSKEAKLHDFLNRRFNYHERVKRGHKLSSGHLAKIEGSEAYLAFFDSLEHTVSLERESPMGVMVNTLYTHSFVPVSSEGSIQLPAF